MKHKDFPFPPKPSTIQNRPYCENEKPIVLFVQEFVIPGTEYLKFKHSVTIMRWALSWLLLPSLWPPHTVDCRVWLLTGRSSEVANISYSIQGTFP